MKKPRILVNIPRYDYGQKELGSSFEYDTFYRNFEDLEYDVELFDYASEYQRGGSQAVDTAIRKRLVKKRYDLIFTVPFTHQFEYQTLDALKHENSGARSVAWMCDDKWRWESFSRQFIGHFDYIVTTDPDAVAKYQQAGFSEVLLSQWAHNQNVYSKIECSKSIPVSFVGGISPWREYVISYLKKQGIQVERFGTGWDNGRVSVHDIVQIYNKSKIVLNLSNSTQWNIPFLLAFKPFQLQGSLKESIAHSLPGLAELYTSKKRNEDIKARFFEVTATGSFLLSYSVEHLDKYLEPERNFASYATLDELSAQIRYYLAHEAERERIAKAGYTRTKSEHTYQKRFMEIFSAIGLS